MKLRRRVHPTIRNLLRKQQLESQLDEELRSYADMVADEKVAGLAKKQELK